MHSNKDNISQPLVSIIVPVHNTGIYLEECLESLINQTLEDIEIICVNDASTDNSLNILNAYAHRDSRIIVIDSKVNVKAGGARNLGIKAANAIYVGFVDSDDFVSKNMYQTLVENSEDMTADIVNTNLYVYHDDMDMPYHNIPIERDLTIEEIKCLIAPYGMRMVTGIFKKTLFDNFSLYYPENVFYEDNAISIPLFLMADSIVLINNIYPTYYYRTTNESSITKSSISLEKLYDRRATAFMMLNHTKRLGCYEKYSEEIDFVFYKLFLRNTLAVYLSKNRFPNLFFMKRLYQDYEKYSSSKEIYYNKYYIEYHSKFDSVLKIIRRIVHVFI